uniref:Uncharacterized protein n=1 Tax=Anguilla anguilla TaxID=7936 RepID=A0A0E9UKJ0_ANGAN
MFPLLRVRMFWSR